MFDRNVDAFMSGHFQITIESHKNPDGTYTSVWVGPGNQKIEATSLHQTEAHRLVSDKVREGVMKREINLSN